LIISLRNGNLQQYVNYVGMQIAINAVKIVFAICIPIYVFCMKKRVLKKCDSDGESHTLDESNIRVGVLNVDFKSQCK
jgi:hypothetical protein